MQSILAAFPRRPLTLSDAGAGAMWLKYLGIVIGAAGLYFFSAWQVPGLVRDYSIRTNPLPIPYEDWSISKGECRTHKGLLTNCDVDFHYSVDGTRHEANVDISFVSFGGGDYEVTAIRDANDPARATLDLALDNYLNRVLTILGILALLAGILVFSLLNLLKSRAMRRAAQQPGPMTPVAITVTQAERTWAYFIVSYVQEMPGGPERKLTAFFPKKQDLFYLSATGGDASALAVIPAGSDTAIPLTEALDTIDLTESERNALRAARSQAEAA